MNPQTKQKLLDLAQRLEIDAKGVVATAAVNAHNAVVDGIKAAQVISSARNLLRLLGKAGEPWAQSFNDNDRIPTLATYRRVYGSLVAVRQAVEDGLIGSLEDSILSEAFGDLLDQADHLLKHNYFLAAGVLGRAVLEEHLRKLSQNCNCFPAKKNPTLNDYIQALYQSQVLTKIEMKQAESYATVGNDAAHAAPTLTKANVEWLLQELPTFLAAHPL